MPVIPDCHGRLYFRSGSKPGCCWTSTRFDDVRDRVLVELLDPALVDHQRQVALVVGEDDDVLVDRLPPRERALDLPEVLGVRVDVLDVVDLDAGLLRERRERPGLLRLRVDVDVERPVREAKRAPRASASCCCFASAATAPPQAAAKPGNREQRRSERGSPQQLFSGQRRSRHFLLCKVDDEGGFGVEADGDRVARRWPDSASPARCSGRRP